MRIWFEGQSEIACGIENVKAAAENLGEYFTGVVGRMPSLANVELVDQGQDFVTIKTNEGLMNRTNITKRITAESVIIECDEVYAAGSIATTKAHFLDEFTVSETGVVHRTVISDLEARGIMGFFYRAFASGNIGKAFLKSTKDQLEQNS